jgi:hypothetical protein
LAEFDGICPPEARTMKTFIMLFLLFATTLSAADITGIWKAGGKTTNGTIKRKFVFKQDGTKLTGKTISDRFGASTIKDGKIEGDSLSFTITVDIEFGTVKISVTGKVRGDVIDLTAEFEGNTVELTAKREGGGPSL